MPNPRWRGALPWIAAALLAATVAFIGSKAIPREAYLSTHDVWFEGDLRRVFSNMVARNSDHYRSKVHPLFSIVAYVLVWVPRRLMSVDPVLSVRIAGAALALIWGGLLFALLRIVTGSAAAALLMTLASVVSASFVFWATVPETYIFGSASILFALLLAARATRSEAAVTASVAATLAFTITNVMAGLAAAIATLPWRRALQAAANALAIVVLLWGVQKFIIPSTQFFIGDKEEKEYMFRLDGARVAAVTKSFAVTSVVTPRPVIAYRYYQAEGILFTQPASHEGVLQWSAIAAWLALLALGVAGLRSAPELRGLRIALLLTLAGQFALHVVYGEETFLYSLHFAPLLFVLAAFAFRTRFRIAAFVLTAVLVILAGTNNARQFDYARGVAASPPKQANSPAG